MPIYYSTISDSINSNSSNYNFYSSNSNSSNNSNSINNNNFDTKHDTKKLKKNIMMKLREKCVSQKKVVDKKQLEKEKSVHKFLTEDIFQEMYQDLNAFPDVKDVIEQREWIPVNRVADLRINDIVRPGYDLSGTCKSILTKPDDDLSGSVLINRNIFARVFYIDDDILEMIVLKQNQYNELEETDLKWRYDSDNINEGSGIERQRRPSETLDNPIIIENDEKILRNITESDEIRNPNSSFLLDSNTETEKILHFRESEKPILLENQVNILINPNYLDDENQVINYVNNLQKQNSVDNNDGEVEISSPISSTYNLSSADNHPITPPPIIQKNGNKIIIENKNAFIQNYYDNNTSNSNINNILLQIDNNNSSREINECKRDTVCNRNTECINRDTECINRDTVCINRDTECINRDTECNRDTVIPFVGINSVNTNILTNTNFIKTILEVDTDLDYYPTVDPYTRDVTVAPFVSNTCAQFGENHAGEFDPHLEDKNTLAKRVIDNIYAESMTDTITVISLPAERSIINTKDANDNRTKLIYVLIVLVMILLTYICIEQSYNREHNEKVLTQYHKALNDYKDIKKH